VEPLVKHGLLGVHLLKIARRVAVHLDAVRRGRNHPVRAIHVVLRMGECWCAGLAVCRHAEVEEVPWSHAVPRHVAMLLLLLCACPVIVVLVLEDLRAESVLQMLHVELRGQFAELLSAVVAVAVVYRREVQVDVFEQITEFMGA
jgi:hypothetical protein